MNPFEVVGGSRPDRTCRPLEVTGAFSRFDECLELSRNRGGTAGKIPSLLGRDFLFITCANLDVKTSREIDISHKGGYD